MLRAAFGLFANFLTWTVGLFAALVAFDSVTPGAGLALLEGGITLVLYLLDSAPAGLVIGLILLLPAYYLGNRVTVARIIADGKAKLKKDEERYTL